MENAIMETVVTPLTTAGAPVMEAVTTYQSAYKANDRINHTLYHVRVDTLYDKSVFRFQPNREKFLLGEVIVYFLKLQGRLRLERKTGNTIFLSLGDAEQGGMLPPNPPAPPVSSAQLTSDKAGGSMPPELALYFRYDAGYESALRDFVPEEGRLYNVMVKPSPSSAAVACRSATPTGAAVASAPSLLYVFAIHLIEKSDEEVERKFFLERCAVEQKYYQEKSVEYSKSLVSGVVTLNKMSNGLIGATDEELNDDLLNNTSQHLLITVPGSSRKFRPEELPDYKKSTAARYAEITKPIYKPTKSTSIPETPRPKVAKATKASSGKRKALAKGTMGGKSNKATKHMAKIAKSTYSLLRDNPLFASNQ
jgi:hypothetical protein